MKTVGPPDSGKLNVRWDGKGMVNGKDEASEALQRGKPAATDRPHLQSLNHSFTLDFVAVCSSEAEAANTLQTVGSALSGRRLALNLDKTRIVPPSKPFEFLGYRFDPDGRVVPPETLPEVVRRRVVRFARDQISKRRRW
jgi:hypothetical protein